MSLKLRAAFEGEGLEPKVHLRRLARLKNEWPELFDAIEDSTLEDGWQVDLHEIADRLVEAEREAHPLVAVDKVLPTDGGGVLATENVRQYLDNAIRSWRRIQRDPDHENNPLAAYYVDAFQSARVSLLGDLLPLEDEDGDRS